MDKDFFEVLVENGSDAIVSIDEDSEVVFANSSVERIFGYEPEELVGEPLTKIMPESFHDAHHDAVDEYIRTGERNLDWNNIELPGVRKDGTEVPLSITFEEHEYDGESVFSGIMRDITEQKGYEETLEKLQNMARRLMETRTKKETAEVALDAVSEILGFPLSDIHLHEETSDRLVPVAYTSAVEEVIGEPPTFTPGDSIAWRVFENRETEVHDELAGDDNIYNPETDVAGEIIAPLGDHGVLIVGRTSGQGFGRRGVELVELLASNTEAALNRSEREEELTRQNHRLERFAALLSHDLRGPLNTAKAKVAVARQDGDEALDGLEELHERMEQLVEDVLELTKKGDAVGETESVDIEEVAREAWETAGVDSEKATLEVVGTREIEADPERLRTVFENLMSNSLRHGGEGVTVRVGKTDDRRGFYVEDDGSGVSDEERDDVFEYGHTTDEDGAGFGLSIVSDIAEAHGWTVSLTESSEGGARFDFEFTPTVQKQKNV